MRGSSKTADLGWDDLPSGSAISLGGGLTGYIAEIEGATWWWIKREGALLIEGAVENAEAARKAVFGALWDLAAKLR